MIFTSILTTLKIWSIIIITIFFFCFASLCADYLTAQSNTISWRWRSTYGFENIVSFKTLPTKIRTTAPCKNNINCILIQLVSVLLLKMWLYRVIQWTKKTSQKQSNSLHKIPRNIEYKEKRSTRKVSFEWWHHKNLRTNLKVAMTNQFSIIWFKKEHVNFEFTAFQNLLQKPKHFNLPVLKSAICFLKHIIMIYSFNPIFWKEMTQNGSQV